MRKGTLITESTGTLTGDPFTGQYKIQEDLNIVEVK